MDISIFKKIWRKLFYDPWSFENIQIGSVLRFKGDNFFNALEFFQSEGQISTMISPLKTFWMSPGDQCMILDKRAGKLKIILLGSSDIGWFRHDLNYDNDDSMTEDFFRNIEDLFEIVSTPTNISKTLTK